MKEKMLGVHYKLKYVYIINWEMIKLQKDLKITIILLLIFFILFIIIYRINGDYVFESSSDNGMYRIAIKSSGAFLFSSEDISINAYKGLFKKIKYKSSIANDGKTLNKSNFDIIWKENIAILTIKGEEQDDEVLNIDFNNNKISHHKIFYKLIKSNQYKDKPEIQYFDYFGKESEYVSYGIKIVNEKNEDLILYNPKDFIRTLKYQKEDGIISIKWYPDGNAYVYKSLDFTFIDCGYDRSSNDYNIIESELYKKYIIAGPDFNYDYELCKPKQN